MPKLKQSTAVTISLGQFVDKTDGVTPKTALTMTVYLSKNGGAFAARNSAGAIAHSRDGYYLIPLSATDTDTTGILEVIVTDSATHLGVNRVYEVWDQPTYDSLVTGSDLLQVDATEWLGEAIATPDTAGYPKTTIYDLTSAALNDIWTTAITEAYAADGAAATPAQLLYMLLSALAEFSISGTTITCKKINGSTTAMTYTINDATNPTSRTRAT